MRRDYDYAERVGTKPVWDAFIEKHPSGFYTALAKANRDKLAAEATRIEATNRAKAAQDEQARLAIEGAKAAAAYAANAVSNNAPDAAIAVSIAKSQCGRMATEIIRDCLQMHGGIGLTWEHDIHLYLRRAVSNEQLWGSPAAHHERLCQLAGL